MLTGFRWAIRMPLAALLIMLAGSVTRAVECAPDQSITGATVKIAGAAPARLAMDEALESTRAMLAAARARRPELESMPAWPRVAELARAAAAIESDLAAGNVARAYDRTMSWKLRFLRQQVADELLTAVPLLALGPFQDARFARLAEVDAARRAAYLQIPFLDEYRADKDGGVNWKWMTQDFSPDLGRTYQVHGGARGWETAVKTNVLALDGWNAGGEWTILYLYTEVYSPEARKGAILYRDSESLAGYGAWLNGNWVGGVTGNFYEYGGRMNMSLTAGWNSLLLKVIHRGPARLRFTIVWGWQHFETTPMYDLQFRAGKAPE